jgi:hypothetical protein
VVANDEMERKLDIAYFKVGLISDNVPGRTEEKHEKK